MGSSQFSDTHLSAELFSLPSFGTAHFKNYDYEFHQE
jgi:hypothetical protein